MNYLVSKAKNDTKGMAYHATKTKENAKQLAGNVIDLAVDAVSTAIPFVPAGVTKIDNVYDVVKTVNKVDKVNDTVKVVDKVDDARDTVITIKKWKPGDPIDLPTKNGDPAWSTVRKRYWKNEALENSNKWSEPNIDRMKKGKAPLDQKGTSYEIDHIGGRKIPKANSKDNLRHMTKKEHIQRHKRDGYTDLEKYAPNRKNLAPKQDKTYILIPYPFFNRGCQGGSLSCSSNTNK